MVAHDGGPSHELSGNDGGPSHEVLEMMADPFLGYLALMGDPLKMGNVHVVKISRSDMGRSDRKAARVGDEYDGILGLSDVEMDPGLTINAPPNSDDGLGS